MKDKKWFLSSLLIASTIQLFLAACTVDPPQNITADKIRGDLVNRNIEGMPDGGFRITEPGYVDLIDLTYEKHRATAHVFVKTVDVASQSGVQGRLGLSYRYESGAWILAEVNPESIERMNPAYAGRLAELIDFPLHFAANTGDMERVAGMLKKGIPVDSPEEKKLSSALMFASERGFLEIVKLLMENGADANYRNKFGFNALLASVHGNHYNVATFLIVNGAEVNAQDDYGRTPLYVAAENNFLEMAKLLVTNGADLNAATKKNWTPLFIAASQNSLDVANHLIEQGAEVNVKTAGTLGSPLLAAAHNNHIEMVRLLLQAGADPRAKLSGKHHSRYGDLTALEIAKEQGHEEVVELLNKVRH